MPKTGNKRGAHQAPTGPASALTRWPQAPSSLSPPERAAWRKIGAAALAGGVVTEADLPLCERIAQLDVRVDAALADPDTRPTALASLLRLYADGLGRIGCSPAGRNTTATPRAPLPENDELAEFLSHPGKRSVRT